MAARESLDIAFVANVVAAMAKTLSERIEDADLIERQPGRDGRTRALHLTVEGRDRAQAILDARTAVVAGALEPLTPSQLRALGSASSSSLRHLTSGRTVADQLCRLCDEQRCPDERCPVETAVPPEPAAKPGS